MDGVENFKAIRTSKIRDVNGLRLLDYRPMERFKASISFLVKISFYHPSQILLLSWFQFPI